MCRFNLNSSEEHQGITSEVHNGEVRSISNGSLHFSIGPKEQCVQVENIMKLRLQRIQKNQNLMKASNNEI